MREYNIGKIRPKTLKLTDSEIKNLAPTLASKILRDNRWYWVVYWDTCYYYVPEWKYNEDLMYLLKNKISADRFEEVDREMVDEIMDKMDEE